MKTSRADASAKKEKESKRIRPNMMRIWEGKGIGRWMEAGSRDHQGKEAVPLYLGNGRKDDSNAERQ